MDSPPRVRRQWPVTPSHALAPDLRRGHCVTGAARLDAAAWQSEDPEQRELAVIACAWCPVLARCRDWSAGLADTHDGVLAGLTRDERQAARKRQSMARSRERERARQGTLGRVNLNTIRAALAAQVTAGTGLRCDAQAHDSITVPCAVVMPPAMTVATTMNGQTSDVRLDVIVLVSDAQPAEASQARLGQLTSSGPGADPGSVVTAVESDPTLGGTAGWCHVLAVAPPSRLDWAGQVYMSARLTLSVGS